MIKFLITLVISICPACFPKSACELDCREVTNECVLECEHLTNDKDLFRDEYLRGCTQDCRNYYVMCDQRCS
jgi:hypothetical protein